MILCAGYSLLAFNCNVIQKINWSHTYIWIIGRMKKSWLERERLEKLHTKEREKILENGKKRKGESGKEGSKKTRKIHRKYAECFISYKKGVLHFYCVVYWILYIWFIQYMYEEYKWSVYRCTQRIDRENPPFHLPNIKLYFQKYFSTFSAQCSVFSAHCSPFSINRFICRPCRNIFPLHFFFHSRISFISSYHCSQFLTFAIQFSIQFKDFPFHSLNI